MLEQRLLDLEVNKDLDPSLKKIFLEIKNLSVEVQRWKPMDWNQLLNVVLGT